MKKLLILTLSIFSFSLFYGQSQGNINQDAYEQYQKSEKEINVIYQQILKEYKDDPVFLNNLKITQRLWIQFRDAEVKAMYPDRGEGFYGSMHSTCLSLYKKELTDERIKKLKVWLLGIEETNECSGSVKITNNQPSKKQKPQNIERALTYIAENLDAATFLPIRVGWAFDYGFKEGWLLNKFEYVRSLVNYKDFQAMLDYPIYLSGPHSKEALNLSSKSSFGYYNPKFVTELRKSVLTMMNNKAFITHTKPLFEKYGILEFLIKHKEIYDLTQQNPEEFNKIKSDYLKAIKSKTLEEGAYRSMLPEQLNSDYYWNWSETSYHFWVRRDIDKTKDLWISLISKVLKAYNS